MNYLQLQLLEYAYKCITEDSSEKYQLIIKSNDDIFTAKTFLVDEYNSVKFQIYSPNSYDFYVEKTISYSNENPFFIVRQFIYDKILKNPFGSKSKLVIKSPEIFFKEISDFILSLEIKHDFKMPKIFYHYESMINENLKLDFVQVHDDSFVPISVKFI